MRRIVAVLAVIALAAPLAKAEDNLESLVDQLAKIDEPGFGYSAYFSGTEFLPYRDTGEISTLVLGAAQHARSETLRRIVEKGTDSVPVLLKHLDDPRKIQLKPLSGMMWLSFPDEYDFNRRTKDRPPAGVNRGYAPLDKGAPDNHAITVGDLCFVALGQVVNRAFVASRYQPTGGLVINSPTYSKTLCKVTRDDWSKLTRQQHRQLLIDDFKTPDYEGRRIGAYLRLAFYYPDAVEPLVLTELAKPTFDALKIEALCREQLYKAKQPAQRRQIFEAFIKSEGPASAAGVQAQLFDDLEMLEASEEHRLSPALTAYSTQPRELLIQLFGKPSTVKSADRPFVDESSEAAERARFIRALAHDPSQKIGDAVKAVYLKNRQDDYMASACLVSLASRGYGDFLLGELRRVDFATTTTDPLKLSCLEAIATSQAEPVQAELLKIIRGTINDDYFMAALAGVKKADDDLVLEAAKKILGRLPVDTNHGEGILTMIEERYPKQAKEIFKSFLAVGSARRAETMCRVLWNGGTMTNEVLKPLLDDKRFLDGFNSPIRVCDRAAKAITNGSHSLKFDEDWPVPKKDAAIAELKTTTRSGHGKPPTPGP